MFRDKKKSPVLEISRYNYSLKNAENIPITENGFKKIKHRHMPFASPEPAFPLGQRGIYSRKVTCLQSHPAFFGPVPRRIRQKDRSGTKMKHIAKISEIQRLKYR